jgi:hypothetical protein
LNFFSTHPIGMGMMVPSWVWLVLDQVPSCNKALFHLAQIMCLHLWPVGGALKPGNSCCCCCIT